MRLESLEIKKRPQPTIKIPVVGVESVSDCDIATDRINPIDPDLFIPTGEIHDECREDYYDDILDSEPAHMPHPSVEIIPSDTSSSSEDVLEQEESSPESDQSIDNSSEVQIEEKVIDTSNKPYVAPEKKRFWVNNGPIIEDLTTLKIALESIPPIQYQFHVSGTRNDFADWVESVLGDRVCAELMRHAKSQRVAIEQVETALTRYDS